MKDIEKAILAEQEYINNPDHQNNSIYDYIISGGYTDIDEYFTDKKEYYLHQLNTTFEYVQIENGFTKGLSAVNESKPSLLAIGEDCTWAWVSRDEFDFDKAKELGIKVFNWNYPGGTIITDSNDFNVAMIIPSYVDIDRTYIANKIVNFIKKHGIDAEYIDNDILSNGKKIAGITGYTTEKSFLFCMSLSLNDHSDLIKQLCTKNSVKVPGFISGITRKEFEEEFESWLRSI